jgi:hypothetical protein
MEKLVNDEIQLFGACTVAAAAKTTHGTFNLDKNRHTHTTPHHTHTAARLYLPRADSTDGRRHHWYWQQGFR